MHYANTVAAKFPGSVTMIAKENGPAMGQRKGMSQRDVEIVNKMYCKPECECGFVLLLPFRST